MKNKRSRFILSILALTALVMLPFHYSQAASLTSISDTLSTLTQNVAANHTIQFVTPTGVEASTDTIVIDLTDFANGGGADYTDIDLAYDTDGTCTTFSNTKTLAAAAGAGAWGASFSSLELTLTAPTDAAAGEIVATRCVQVLIGTNASGGNAQLTNPNDTNTHAFDISGTFGDTGSFAVDFVADDSVNVTATVDPSIDFAISDTTIGFGTLSATNDQYATADLVGATDETEAHTLTCGTNATDGYSITVNGVTLTSAASDTIDAIGAVNSASATGTEQFGIRIDESGGDGAVSAPYAAAGFALDTAAFPDEVAASTGPSADTTYSVRYLANVAADTEAGTYTTNLTYIATATF
ncbi:MAG: hypothetical protein WC495_04395 [Patescibacteria group bacterium]|jgi:hypothetical protein